MTEIVNLRTRRKQLTRAAAAHAAAQNRAYHGRTRAEHETTEAIEALDTKRLDGHRLSGDGEGRKR